MDRVVVDELPQMILGRDYVSADEDSETYSIAVSTTSHWTSAIVSMETKLMMIEDPNHEDFIELQCYRCHLMSQTSYPSLKNNPNNYLDELAAASSI